MNWKLRTPPLILLLILPLILQWFSAGLLATEYLNSQNQFSLTYDPALWELSDKKAGIGPQGTDADKAMADRTLVALQKIKAFDRYHARFSVVAENADKFQEKGKDALQSYYKHSIQFLKSQRFEIIDTKPITLDNLKTRAFETIASQRDFGLTFRQVVFLRGKDAYLLTAALRTSRYDGEKASIDPLIQSLRFKTANP